ncbi:MAG: hypothetical protein U0165_20975 [Polyangiaceae bacterium]
MIEHSAHPVAGEVSESLEESPLVLTWADRRPRILDLELAERLGYDRPRAIRGLIRRLIESGALAEVQHHATSRTFELELDTEVNHGGSVGEVEYWLTEEQALLVCSRSNAQRGAHGHATRTEAVQKIISAFVAARDHKAAEEVEARRQELEIRKLEAEAATARARSAILDTTLSQISDLERHGVISTATAVYQRARVVRELLGIDLVERHDLRPATKPAQVSLPLDTSQEVPRDIVHAGALARPIEAKTLGPKDALAAARRTMAIEAIDTTGFVSARTVGREFSLSGQVVGRLAREMGLYGNDAYGLWRQFQPNDGSTPLKHWMYSEDARALLRPRLAEIRRARDARAVQSQGHQIDEDLIDQASLPTAVSTLARFRF